MASLSPAPHLVVPPASAPVTLTEAKAHCRVDHTDEDALIEALLLSAVAYLDGWAGVLGRAIMPQQWQQEFAGWGDLALALPDVTAVTVAGFDAEDAPVVATKADLVKWPGGWVVVSEGPAVDRVRVTYTCGLPAARLPAAQALVKLLVGHWYGNREAVITGTITADVPMSASAIIQNLRPVRV